MSNQVGNEVINFHEERIKFFEDHLKKNSILKGDGLASWKEELKECSQNLQDYLKPATCFGTFLQLPCRA